MREVVRTLLCGAALNGTLLLSTGQAAPGDCKAKAPDVLKSASPSGYAIYQQITDRAFFRTWLDCEDAQFGLPTAVHESVHRITEETDAYPLVGGGSVKRPLVDKALFAPVKISRRFPASSLFVTTYLRPGSATSAADFRYLLDELNAYTHDLDTAVALDDRRNRDSQTAHRDGLAALMSFVAVYVEAAETNPSAWSGLKHVEMATALSTIWTQAERTMLASCRIPDIGVEDKGFLNTLCGSKPQSALEHLLGRAPVCPRACLANQRTISGSE